jgi:hypothetical protein
MRQLGHHRLYRTSHATIEPPLLLVTHPKLSHLSKESFSLALLDHEREVLTDNDICAFSKPLRDCACAKVSRTAHNWFIRIVQEVICVLGQFDVGVFFVKMLHVIMQEILSSIDEIVSRDPGNLEIQTFLFYL